jgi:bifunctional pyridoxal-dependent enzyme with beta-cystathionase and maltose regulon repressor activities
MILSSSQLRALKERNDEELRKGKHGKYGYPAHTIQDLLQTIEALKKEKRKWKQLAQERGRVLQEIVVLTLKAAPPARDPDEDL